MYIPQLAGPPCSREESELLPCVGCPYRGPQCGSRGNLESEIVFVGEAPGYEEVRHGLPLVGPSGLLFWGTMPLFETLKEMGLNPEDFLILNTAQCQPFRSKDQRKNMANVMRAMNHCNSRLLEQVQRHPRKLVVAMGNFAVWALTGQTSSKITQIRGQLLQSPLAGLGILPTVHPAGILRGTGNYRQYRMDIEYALDLVRGYEPKKPVDTYFLVCDTSEKVKQATKRLMKSPVIDLDIETTGFNPRIDDILCIGIAKSPRLVYIFPGAIRSVDRMIELGAHESWMDGAPSMIPYLKEFFQKYRNKMRFRVNNQSLSQKLKFQDTDGKYEDQVGGKQCWHNGKFDIAFLRELGIEDAHVDEDTMLMSYTLDEQRGIHDLEQVAADLLGAPDYKYMLNPWVPRKRDSYAKVPRPVLYNYLALDVGNTGGIRQILRRRVFEDPKLEKLYKHLIATSETLTWVEKRGMPASRFALQRQQKRLQKELNRTVDILNFEARKAVGDPTIYVNPGSPQQMAWLLWDVLKLQPPKGIPKSTNKEVLERLPQVPVVKALREYRKANKAKGTYADALLEAIDPVTERIHPGMLIHGTRTGRLAHKVVANIPRDKRLRGMFAFDPPLVNVVTRAEPELLVQHGFDSTAAITTKERGRIFIKTDIDQAELRSLAAVSADPELCAIYLSNTRKLHREVASKIWGSPGTTEGKKSGEYKWGNEEYMRAKALNFGIVYGREPPSIAQEFGIPVGEAEGYVRFWREMFPTAWDFIQWCRSAPRQMKTLVTPFGRKKRHWVVTRENVHGLENEASNFPHQSIANDIVLDASNKLSVRLRKLDVHIIFLVHDEILVDAPDDLGLVREVREMIPEQIEQSPRDWGITRIPFKADTSVGRRWGVYRGYDKKGLWNEYLRNKIHLVSSDRDNDLYGVATGSDD